MSTCEPLTAQASDGVAAALRAVDCLAGETTASAFARLFGGDSASGGALLPALTILLTIYIALFAFALLTGRSRIGIAALTPRMMTVGLVLTFATSWVAYSQVVWNLTTGAPDQIAGILMGGAGGLQGGSATQLFADRIDIVFAAIAEVGEQTGQGGAQGAAGPAAGGAFSPSGLMWLAAILLLLGTVGVLVTARIALAVLLAVGPVFVVLALFSGTRGLFVGWLRGVAMTALAPLFAVLGGSFMIELAVPVIAGLRSETGVDARAAMALFLIASVHCALMVLIMRVAGTMVAGWGVFGLAESKERETEGVSVSAAAAAAAAAAPALAAGAGASASANPGARRSGALIAPLPLPANEAGAVGAAGRSSSTRTLVTHVSAGQSSLPMLPRTRARGIGSRFASPTKPPREMIR